MSYVQTVKTDAEIISLADTKAYLRVTSTADDALITELIKAAITDAEKTMRRDILTTTYENFRDSFHQDLTLRRGKFQSLTSVEFLKDGTYTTLATTEYTVNTGGIFGEICEIDVPDSDRDCNDVRITFKTGFGDAKESVPSDIKLALKLLVSFWYSNRGDCIIPSGRNSENGIVNLGDVILKKYKIIDAMSGDDILRQQ